MSKFTLDTINQINKIRVQQGLSTLSAQFYITRFKQIEKNRKHQLLELLYKETDELLDNLSMDELIELVQ